MKAHLKMASVTAMFMCLAASVYGGEIPCLDENGAGNDTVAAASSNSRLRSPEDERAPAGPVFQVRAFDQANLRFNGPGPDAGREAQADVDFPEGNWSKVELTLTLNSYATPGRCTYPNPTGDIYDRSASVFLILDESCRSGTRCMGTPGQIELLKAITPFGTDERTGPRVLTYDVTPFAPLLTGHKALGVWVDTYDQNGWWADVDFSFTRDPQERSPRTPPQGKLKTPDRVGGGARGEPKPPADGIQPVFFKYRVTFDDQKGILPFSITIPETATQVFLRLFATGHGAVGQPPCDEFCQRANRILVDDEPVWERVVWRTDCSPGAPDACRAWNACGYPSCRYSRSGWCPGYIACHENDPCDQDLDATQWLAPGGTYNVLYNIPNLTPGGAYWNYSLVVYWYE